MKNKMIGHNFFHTHEITEKCLNLDEQHCIIDRKDYNDILNFFRDNPYLLNKIGEKKDLNDAHISKITKEKLKELTRAYELSLGFYYTGKYNNNIYLNNIGEFKNLTTDDILTELVKLINSL